MSRSITVYYKYCCCSKTIIIANWLSSPFLFHCILKKQNKPRHHLIFFPTKNRALPDNFNSIFNRQDIRLILIPAHHRKAAIMSYSPQGNEILYGFQQDTIKRCACLSPALVQHSVAPCVVSLGAWKNNGATISVSSVLQELRNYRKIGRKKR